MKKLVLLLFLLMSVSTFAKSSSKWQKIASGVEEFGTVYLDTNSVYAEGGLDSFMTGWLKSTNGECTDPFDGNNCYYHFQARASCGQNLIEFPAFKIFHKKLNIRIGNEYHPGKETVEPDSIGEDVYKQLCKNYKYEDPDDNNNENMSSVMSQSQSEIEQQPSNNNPTETVQPQKKDDNKGLEVFMNGLGKILNKL
ncbi:hypothetical protein [Neisseria sp. Ec49-e6-T10]|uniref:hypothetical protein n=1 Tax=Neisseria sp. Ec49-e6-T10 TaxID=3140744 RepID=UPI003EBBC332